MNLRLLSVALLFACHGADPVAVEWPEPGADNPLDLQAELQVDRLHPIAVRGTDVLLVVDNSGSMLQEQPGFNTFVPVFMDYLLGSGIDYHVGVISTDMEDPQHSGRLRQAGGVRWVDEHTSNPTIVLASMMQMGTDGSSPRGLDAVVHALLVEGDGYNAGFRRDDAVLNVVVLSDGADHSVIVVDDFTAWLSEQASEPGLLGFSSVVPLGGAGCGPVVGDPARYLQVTDLVGGLTADLCAPAFDEAAQQLGVHVQIGVGDPQSSFPLSRLPVLETLEVTESLEGVTIVYTLGDDYHYDPVRNAVVLVTYPPPPGALLEATYEVLEARVGTPGAGG